MSSSRRSSGANQPKPSTSSSSKPSTSANPKPAAGDVVDAATVAKIKSLLIMPIEPSTSLKKALPGLSKHVSLLHPQLCLIYFYLCIIVWRQTRELLFALVSPDPPPSDLDDLVNLPALADLATLVHRIWKPWSAKTWPTKKHLPLLPPFVVTTLASAEFVARLYRPSVVDYTFQLPREFLTMPINDPLQDLIKPLWTRPSLAYPRLNLYEGLASWIPLVDVYMRIFHLEVAIPPSKSEYPLGIESVTLLHIRDGKSLSQLLAVVSDDSRHIFPSDLGKVDVPKELDVEVRPHPPAPENRVQGRLLDLSPSAGLATMLPDARGPYGAYLKEFPVLPFFLPTPDADNKDLVMASYDDKVNAELLYGGLRLVSDHLVPLLKILAAETAVGVEAQEIAALPILMQLRQAVQDVIEVDYAASARRLVPAWIPCVLLSAEILVRLAADHPRNSLKWYLPEDWVHRSNVNLANWFKPFWFFNSLYDAWSGHTFPLVAPDTTTIVQMVADFGPEGFAPLEAVDIPWYTKTMVRLRNPKADIDIAVFLSAPPLEDAWLTAGILPPHTGGLAPHPDEIPTSFHGDYHFPASTIDLDTTYKPAPVSCSFIHHFLDITCCV
ncbi:hypothetical protein V5O48_017084 [Marasmius crinis-equi]|uniref:Uncharacterized protein n=1 Tax=Marasmius crinis-equi TaxID=585013 RepID=A0ABR3EPY8_9AGAR